MVKFPGLLNFLSLKLHPPGGVRPVGVIDFLSSSWQFPDFGFFDPLNSPLGGVGQICLGSNDSQINPHMRAKFGCSQTVMSEKMGGTDTQTDTQRDTAALCSRYVNQQLQQND